MGPIAYSRAAKMYGTALRDQQPSDHANCGIGPFLRHGLDPDDVPLAVCPTHTYNTPSQTITIGKTTLTLIHAPGETDDQTVVLYEPSTSSSSSSSSDRTKVLLAADNFYESFPNLYTIRGAPSRDVLQWIRSLDLMAQQKATVMIPAHTLPVYGVDEIYHRLTNYRDAIQYVHDQTVQGILRGYHPDTIAQSIQLPTNLASQEYLKEYYGTVEWSSKAIFQHYLGWFSGQVDELHPLVPYEKANRLVRFGGGIDAVLQSAEETIRRCSNNDNTSDHLKDDYQWALELSSAVLRLHEDRKAQSSLSFLSSSVSVTKPTKGQIRRAKLIKAQSCRYLGQRHISANGRNWYLTEAMMCETTGPIDGLDVPPAQRRHAILTMPWTQILNGLSLRLKVGTTAKNSNRSSLEGVEKRMCFIIRPDRVVQNINKITASTSSLGDDDHRHIAKQTVEERWTLHIRNCVLSAIPSIPEEDDQIDILIDCTNMALRNIFANPVKLSSIMSVTSGLFSGGRAGTNSSTKSKASEPTMPDDDRPDFAVMKGDVASAFQFLANLDRTL